MTNSLSNGKDKKRIVIGISGASGVIYGIRLLEILKRINSIETHLVLSKAAEQTIKLESNFQIDEIIKLADVYHDTNNIGASIASGSFPTDGMVVIPCSIKTLSGIVNSYSDNLLTRAADVTLKEKRHLILCIRETPLHQGHLELMLKASQIGCLVMPCSPSFYHHPETINELVNQFIYRVLDQFSLPHLSKKVWNG